jgi:hypothetical protein
VLFNQCQYCQQINLVQSDVLLRASPPVLPHSTVSTTQQVTTTTWPLRASTVSSCCTSVNPDQYDVDIPSVYWDAAISILGFSARSTGVLRSVYLGTALSVLGYTAQWTGVQRSSDRGRLQCTGVLRSVYWGTAISVLGTVISELGNSAQCTGAQ